MTILITRLESVETQVLKVDGLLSAEDTDVLLGACDEVTGRLVLDLSDLRFADRRGVDALRTLRARGIDLIGLSPYLDLLLSRSGRDHT
jgi:hypothetical protein